MNRYKSVIKYELKSIIKNGYVLAFSIILPCILFLLVSRGAVSDLPTNLRDTVVGAIFISISTIIPLAGVFLGHGATYSKEYENGIPQRLSLFGIPTSVLIISKIISQILFVIFAFVVYYIFGIIFGLNINNNNKVIFSMLILLIIQALSQFLLAHSIVNMLKKFGVTYAVTMFLYFLFMIVSGNMGISTEKLPKILRFIGEKMLPFVEYTKFNINILDGKSLDYKLLIMTNLIFLSFGVILLIINRVRNKRVY